MLTTGPSGRVQVRGREGTWPRLYPNSARGLCTSHKGSKRSELSLDEMLLYWGRGGDGFRVQGRKGAGDACQMDGAGSICPRTA